MVSVMSGCIPTLDEHGHVVGFRCVRMGGPPRCRACGEPAPTKLCDWPVPGGTCDAPLCPWCAVSPRSGVDHCPGHYPKPVAKSWLVRLWQWIALTFCLLLSAPAAAAPSRLDTLLARGEALTRAGDTGCATPLEAAALAAEQDDADYARALAALGLCREVQGRFAEAHGLVSRALEGAPPETTKRSLRWALLEAARRRLDERVARVLVTWEDGAELYVDGKPAGGVSGRVMAVDPGRRVFEARRAGKAVAAQEVEARAGDLPAVHLRAPPSPAVTPTKQGDSAHQMARSRPAAVSPLLPTLTPRGIAVGTVYASGAVALVSGIVAGVLEAQRVSLRSGLAPDACPTPDASARCAELRQVFEMRTGARNVALVAAGVAVAAGGVAIGLHFKVDKVAPASAGITLRGSW